MGTRSITRVIDDSWGQAECVAAIYRQYDGYPSGHGAELKEFLGGMQVINGIGADAKAGTHANGAGCLAAQLIARLKADHGLGGVYMVSAGAEPEEYDYSVHVKHGEPVRLVVRHGETLLFDGPANTFDAESLS